MAIYNKLLLIFTFFFLYSCSSSYEKLNNANFSPPDSFSKHLFDMYKEKGLEMGFSVVESGPLVRSSYHADEQAKILYWKSIK